MSEPIDLDAEYALGEEVPAAPRRRRNSELLAVRVPTTLLSRVQELAHLRGVTVSDVVREGLELVLTQQASTATSTRLVAQLVGNQTSFTEPASGTTSAAWTSTIQSRGAVTQAPQLRLDPAPRESRRPR
jgi:hypothetical protein